MEFLTDASECNYSAQIYAVVSFKFLRFLKICIAPFHYLCAFSLNCDFNKSSYL